ncbi:hypothetical protein [Sabulicella rubraurantiaca]|uniref:hypothetical protein n=1 Tax=Sabulicella rubraurantiaca TaxID=2811429 RepID=UPI001A97C71E|nr:hypothetical protein [Sabulicella rubraurantiaca]
MRSASLALLALAACAPPSVLQEPIGGASYTPVERAFAPMPAVMQRMGDPPIALPDPAATAPRSHVRLPGVAEPGAVTPPAAPRSDPTARP